AYIRVVKEPSGEFLLGGFFPNTARGKPLPAELFDRLNTPQLVYYHWEITAERLKELPQLSQLLLMVTHHRQLEGESAGHKWLERITPGLGNCLPIVTETTPAELVFTRKAPAGLTALELMALVDWLGPPNFPANDPRLPPAPQRLRNRPAMPLLPKP